MECQSSDSKKLFKVFDASKNKRSTRKRRDGALDTTSVATDDSNIGCHHHNLEILGNKISLQDLPSVAGGQPDGEPVGRTKASSPSMSRSSREERRGSRSPRRHHRRIPNTREGLSLALKAGMVSTPRSLSPPQKGNATVNEIPQDQDSFIYAFLEEAIKKDKKKNRHGRRRESSRERVRSGSRDREHRHRHRRGHDDRESPSRERDRPKKSPSPGIDQAVLLESFAKMCAQIADKSALNNSLQQSVQRTQSHKSLQCEVAPREMFDDRRPKRLSPERSHHIDFPYRIRSSENCQQRRPEHRELDKCDCCYDPRKYSKVQITPSRLRHDDDRYRDREYPPDTVPTRTFIDYRKECERYHDRRYDDDKRRFDDDKRRFDDDKRRRFEQATSRSFDIQREPYDDRCRRTTRSDKTKHYEDTSKYYDKTEPREPMFLNQEKILVKDRLGRREKRNCDRFERGSIVSRDDEYRDRLSEKERDSGLSVADGDTSTISGRSNYLKVVKQEIAEQREAMDKMMKLWKELMRCFKGISHTQNKDNDKINESADNVRESAAAQLRLWRECMRRYETVARDVGDTDARLMEEITKQRSEMAEMAGMWQECLQRYRDMSNDFNTLKKQLSTSESPTRIPASGAVTPLMCAEGEGSTPAPKYCIPPTYPPQMVAAAPGYPGAALRGRASAPAPPPAWWWGCERDSPRRRSSPDSRASSRRRHRHKESSRDESRYSKDKSKPTAARSEHRHRKR